MKIDNKRVAYLYVCQSGVDVVTCVKMSNREKKTLEKFMHVRSEEEACWS